MQTTPARSPGPSVPPPPQARLGLLAIFGSVAVYVNRERHRELIPYVVAVIATEPLTENETWTRYEPGQWSLWRRGECVSQGKTE